MDCNIEIAALADASTKTSNNDWQVIVDIMSSWASRFTISQQCVRWAVVSYADSARESIALSRYNDLQSLQSAIRTLPLINGGSDLLTALRLLRTQVFLYRNVRTRAALVAGFVTDELPSCSSQLVAEANDLKRLGVLLIGIVLNHRQTVDINCVRQLVAANMYVEITDTSRYAAAVSDAARAVCPPDYWSKSDDRVPRLHGATRCATDRLL